MSAASESAVRVGLVYPELLGTYGDRGNAVVLVQRLRWRGHAAELVEVTAGAPIPDSLDVYLFGGGEDDPQVMASAGMRSSRAAIDRGRAGGAAVLAVCAGFQLIGHSYEAADGTIIDQRSAIQDLPMSASTMTFDFDGGAINRSMKNGPYGVHLTLLDEVSQPLAGTTITTRQYSYCLFGGCRVSLPLVRR